MSTILLIPRTQKDQDGYQQVADKISEAAKTAAKHKTHFVISINPEEFEVFAHMGDTTEVVADDSGLIRINLSTFDGSVPDADDLRDQGISQ